ncbi:MAG: hypothetical protein Q8L66_13345 [Caulobacter sp.]|nr:hypothetical protein [Caulobacter sp.]
MGFALVGLLLAVTIPTVSVLLLNRLVRPPLTSEWRNYLSAFQSVLTVSALVFGSLWFFIERPDSARLDIQQTVTGVELGDGRVLVLVEVGLKNIGNTALNLRKREFLLWIQQVTPLPDGVERDAAKLPNATVESIRPADDWGVLAALDGRPAAARSVPLQLDARSQLDTYLEAGETENLYYRAILPCDPELRIYLTLQMPKPSSWYDGPGGGSMWWVKQTFLDLTDKCPATQEGRP